MGRVMMVMMVRRVMMRGVMGLAGGPTRGSRPDHLDGTTGQAIAGQIRTAPFTDGCSKKGRTRMPWKAPLERWPTCTTP